MEIKSSKHSKIIKIGSYDFGFSYAKGNPTLIAIFFGKRGILFSYPFTYYAILRKRPKMDNKGEDINE